MKAKEKRIVSEDTVWIYGKCGPAITAYRHKVSPKRMKLRSSRLPLQVHLMAFSLIFWVFIYVFVDLPPWSYSFWIDWILVFFCGSVWLLYCGCAVIPEVHFEIWVWEHSLWVAIDYLFNILSLVTWCRQEALNAYDAFRWVSRRLG